MFHCRQQFSIQSNKTKRGVSECDNKSKQGLKPLGHMTRKLLKIFHLHKNFKIKSRKKLKFNITRCVYNYPVKVAVKFKSLDHKTWVLFGGKIKMF